MFSINGLGAVLNNALLEALTAVDLITDKKDTSPNAVLLIIWLSLFVQNSNISSSE